ncbi:MAG: hypothetical protein EOM22_00300 [Gammaproteobacteria bacterium]|nr:hypothetical protein [Gammaproteobacteria bacterium]
MIPLFMIGSLALVMAVVLLLNTGAQSARRIEVQNAVDAAAMTQAAWTARSLNLMSMNNVAMVQMLAMNAAVTALIEVTAEATYQALDQAGEYAERLNNWCLPLISSPLFKYGLACAALYGVKLGHLGLFVIQPLFAIWADDPIGIQSRSAELAMSLEAMNRVLVDDFPTFAVEVQQSLAETNGLGSNVPRFFARFEEPPSADPRSTTLPVEPVNALSLSFPACAAGTLGTVGPGAVESVWTSLQGYCASSDGDRSGGGDIGELAALFGNFDDHGYPAGRGPYPLARDQAGGLINPIVERLEGWVHGVKIVLDFDKLACAHWTAACSTPIVMHRLLVPGPLEMFQVRNRPLLPMMPLGEDRADWSLLAFGQAEYRSGMAASERFVNPSGVIAAYAQAEVYNPISYDLYTQDWRARLAPARLLEIDYGDGRERMLETLTDLAELQALLRGLGPAELGEVNTH